MPYLHLTFGRPVDADTGRFLARHCTELIAELLHKRPEVTAVHLDAARPDGWFIGGAANPPTQMSAHGELYITAGTNTETEKAAFIAALDRLFRDTFGEVPQASYVIVHEIPGSDWGYAGRTQEARRLARLAEAADTPETIGNT